MTLTYDDYATFLINWCAIRGSEFKLYFPLKGGWEAWAQADYAAYVLAQNNTYDILREVAIYTNARQRVDWLFNNNDLDVKKKLAVEIKCQSFENRDAFIAGVEADIAKLAQNKIKLQFRTCQTGVMGIYFEDTARTWMLANNFTEIFVNGEIGCAIRKLN
ncbi:hypothetical protein [Taibaiella koreensis]|uniref:hypothetical protein n=1 Tax=Taibaiella koreensis TaxID=1268548 RepID=UPI000E59BFA1|nr:hypothetical protein [Taibaiella koreensis]